MALLVCTPLVAATGAEVEMIGHDVTVRAALAALVGHDVVVRSALVVANTPTITTYGAALERAGLPFEAAAGAMERCLVHFAVYGGAELAVVLAVAPTGEFSAWVMNTRTGGMGEYVDFPFSSLFRLGSDYYGIIDGDLYKLAGRKDGAADINASLTSGVNDLGTRNRKFFPDVYLAVRCEGELEFTLTVDETVSRTYPVSGRAGQQGIHNKRLPLAKGVTGSRAQIRIANVAGADFDLAQAELIFNPTRRS